MARPIRVAALQLRAHDRDDFPRVLDAIVETVARAAQRADLVVLPEATFPGYVLGDARVDDAAIGGALDRLREIAHASNSVIVAGAARRDGKRLVNAAIVIDADGSIAGVADKIFLWHFDRVWFDPGDRIAPIRTALGVLGVLVCADGRIPTIARALVDRGAQMLVMPTAWVTSGRSPTVLENVQADLLARVRAYENGVPFVAANKCGVERGMVAYCGKSQIIAAAGTVMALGDQETPQIVEARITLDDARPPRSAPSAGPPSVSPRSSPVRVILSVQKLPSDVHERLAWLGGDCALSPNEQISVAPSDTPIARVGDDDVRDPAGLIAYRNAGYACVAWSATLPSQWVEPLARARALELRIYVAVFDLAAQRAFAVDPDGTVIAGTFGDYRLAGFSFDPRRTTETAVAPGTDVSDGLNRVAAILGTSKKELAEIRERERS